MASVAGVSRTTVSSIERGLWRSMPLRTLATVAAAVEADVEVLVRHRGGELDRLLDAAHAAIVAALSSQLRETGWRLANEVRSNHYGDRGSIDLLAYHPATRTVLVVEVKMQITSAEEMLRRLDVKVRLAPMLVPERFGERPARVVRILAVTASSANRARVSRLEPILETAFPLRSRALTGWLRAPGPVPGGSAAGLLFVRNVGAAGVTHGERRVRRPTAPHARSSERERPPIGDGARVEPGPTRS